MTCPMSTWNRTDPTSRLRPAPPVQNSRAAPHGIGDFLIKIGAMTRKQVEHVLCLQAEGDSRRFSEIAFSLRYLKDDSIKRYIDHLEKWKLTPEGHVKLLEQVSLNTRPAGH